jgi:sugar phosphate isomerase/epimerase
MRTSFHTAFLTDLPVLDAMAAVLDSGYDAVELNAETLPWAVPHIAPGTEAATLRAIRRVGPVSAISAHRAGLAAIDDALRTEAIEWTLALARAAHDLECRVVHVIPGDEAEGSMLGMAGGPGDLDRFGQSLRHLVEATAPLGITLALEPIVNQLVSTTEQMLAIASAVPGLHVSFDPSHLQVTTHDVSDAARRLGPLVSNAAIKDAVGTPQDFRFLAPGDGDVDFVAMLTALDEAGFDGYVSVEHEAHVFGDARQVPAVLADSLRALRSYLAALP